MKILPVMIALLLINASPSYGQASHPLQVQADEPIVYIPKTGRVNRWHFVKVRYNGELPTEGFYNVNGTPTRLNITSSNPELLRIGLIGDKEVLPGITVTSQLGEVYVFSNPGDVVITVTVGDVSSTLPVKIVQLPIEERTTTSAQVIETLGFPDEKRKVFVSWPDSENVDGIFYNPRAGGAIMREHWRYKSYPGLVIAISDGTVSDIESNTSTEAQLKAAAAQRPGLLEDPALEMLPLDPEEEAKQKEEEKREASKAAQQRIEAAKRKTWTSANGRYKIEAKFVYVIRGAAVLEKDNGERVTVPLDQLSEEDQLFIKDKKWLDAAP